jgi:hypothetical protein
MNIDKMQPGRELDELVAKMLGWSNIDWHFDRVYPGRTWIGGNPHGDGDRYVEEVPFFSTDIAAAWQVVEKLREKSFAMTISTMGPRQQTSAFCIYEGRKITDHCWGDTAAHAICLAALKVVTVNREGSE